MDGQAVPGDGDFILHFSGPTAAAAGRSAAEKGQVDFVQWDIEMLAMRGGFWTADELAGVQEAFR